MSKDRRTKPRNLGRAGPLLYSGGRDERSYQLLAGDGVGERESLQKDAAAINKKQMAEDRGGGLVW